MDLITAGKLMDGSIERKVSGKGYCEKCKKDFEIIDTYFKGEKKSTIDYCQVCRKKEDDEKLRLEMIEREREKRMKRYKWLSVYPFDLDNATFENYETNNDTQKELLDTSLKFVNGELDKTTLFFQGDTGLGKTHIAYSIYKEMKNKGKTSVFIDLPSLLSTIRNSFKDYSQPNQEQIFKAIEQCDLFILDDIGAEYVKPDASGFESWASDIMFQISNKRQGKMNVYTTNFTSKYLNKKYGMMSKRIISRLMSNAKVIKVTGNDYRLKGLD